MSHLKQIDFKKNRQRRKQKDLYANILTYASALLATVVLVSIFVFIFRRGFSVLSWDMIRNDYWSQNYIAQVNDYPQDSYERPADLDDSIAFSTKYGIGLQDEINQDKQKIVTVAYQAPESVFSSSTIATKGAKYEQPLGDMTGNSISRLTLIVDEQRVNVGTQAKNTAQEVVDSMDSSSEIVSLFYQTPGGGIWGSLIATLLLIFVSLLISLPIGIAAAIYLHEYAKPNKITSFMRSSIEMLSGVPSIIFGLMGVAVLFPITTIFGANTLSTLLGGITMAVMLLPIVIRQTEESLIVVPDGLRNASLSLGATETQTIFKVVLPTALPGIISAILLAVSRVIGESAALIYTMGTTISDSPKLLEGATTLAVSIWSIMGAEQPNFELASAISIVILVLVLGLNIIVKIISNRLNRKWEM